jgi:hypothetical protein
MLLAIDTFPMERFGLVTGSKCSVLFPLRGDGKVGQRTYAKTLANEKFFQFYDERSTWQTEHGKMAEFWAFEHYEKFWGANIKKGEWIKKGECGGTTDAVLPDRGVDFKCPTSLNGWLDYLHDPLDKDQKDQCQMYMYLTGLPMWEIAAFLIETQFMTDNGLTYPVPEDKRMIIVQVQKDETWEPRLNEVLPSIISMREEFYQRLKEQFA